MMDDLLEVVKYRKVSITVEDISAKIIRTCQVCQERFTLVKFISHLKIHPVPAKFAQARILNGLSPRDLTCPICRETFPKETLLRIHQVQKHSSSLVACLPKAIIPPNCRIVRKLFLNHARRRPLHDFKRFKCRHCEKRFVLHSQCKSHENAHAETIESVTLQPAEEPSLEPSENFVHIPVNESESSVLQSSQPIEEAQITINGFNSTTPGSEETETFAPPVSFEIQTATEFGTERLDYGEMEGQSTTMLGIPSGTLPGHSALMEMPKLVPPTQGHRLSDFTNFQDDQNRLFVTSVSSDHVIPVTSEPEIHFDSSMVNGIVKAQVHVTASGTAGLTNGNVFPPQQCDEKMHQCLSCDKTIPESLLFPHIKSHLIKGQKECSLCAYKAIASGDLRDHMNKHYNIRPYKCPIPGCPHAYVWQSGWKKHIETHTKREKTYKCAHCTLGFGTQRELRRHELSHKIFAGPSPPKKQRKASPRPASKVLAEPSSSQPSSDQIPVNPHQPSSSIQDQQYYGDAAHQQHSYQEHQYTSQPPNNYSIPPIYASENFNHHQENYYVGNTTLVQQQQPQQQQQQEQQQYSTNYNTVNTNYVQTQSLGQVEGNYAVGNYGNQGTTPQAENPDWTQQTGEYHNSQGSNSQGVEFGNHVDGEQFPDDLREAETCKTCGLEIPLSELGEHIKKHILPGQKCCTICKYKCTTKSYLEEHYNIHYGLKPYTCPICKRKFAMRSYLRSHTLQVHENESTRRFQCRYCNKRFVRNCHLRTHEKIHEGQGEVLPAGESSFVNPALDSDSNNSNSNASFRPPMTPDRKSSTTSTSSQSNHGTIFTHHSRSNSPQVSTPATGTTTPIKTEHQWNGTPTSGGDQAQGHQHSTPTTPSWPHWSGTHYPPAHGGGYQDNNAWAQGNPYLYYPLVRSDVNWTEPLSESSSWQQQNQGHHSQAHGHPSSSPQVKMEGGWVDSPSNGFHQASNPPSASVHDLWAELHYEEMKWLPETSTVCTPDGIPLVTELAPFDGFSYTEMLNSATADLPLFAAPAAPFLPFSQDLQEVGQTEVKSGEFSSPSSAQGEGKPKSKKVVKPPSSGHQIEPPPLPPPPPRSTKGRGKGKLTAEAKHLLKLSFAKRVPESELDLCESLSSSPKIWEGSEDEGEPIDMDSLTECQTCKLDVIRRDLLNHIRGHVVPGQRTCDICQRTYCNTLTLKEHIHVHYKLKPYKCSFCEEKFSTKYSLKTHETFSHEEGKASIIECPYPGCGKQYAIRSEFHKHVKAHTNKNGTSARQGQSSAKVIEPKQSPSLYSQELIQDAASKTKVWEVRLEDIGRKMTKKCPFCKEEILLADYFEHKYQHKENCHICEKPIPVAEILFHGPTHVSERVCEVCGWTAKQRSQIWEHMNSHLKVKPILCLYCGLRFTSRNTLRTHYLVTHTTFRPHSCRYCEKTFVQYNTMRAHEFTHLGSQCPACPETFSRRKALETHLREAHKYDY